MVNNPVLTVELAGRLVGIRLSEKAGRQVVSQCVIGEIKL